MVVKDFTVLASECGYSITLFWVRSYSISIRLGSCKYSLPSRVINCDYIFFLLQICVVLKIIIALYLDLLGFICTCAVSSHPLTCSHPTGLNTPNNQSVPFLIPRDSVQSPRLPHPTKLCVLGGGINLSLDFPSSWPWKFRELLEALLSGVSCLPCSWLFLVTPSP